MEEKLEICDGKYTLIFHNDTGIFFALPRDKKLRDLTGDQLVYGLYSEVIALRSRLAEAEQALEPFAKRNGEFIFTVGGMATVDFSWLRAAAKYREKYAKA